VPFLKFSRDKRGYEHFYLVEAGSRGKPRTRLLYWFRTPPNVKVGRTPFDPDMRRVLEDQNPDVVFDWDAIVRTPIPPPSDTERWRERRRIERAIRASEAEEIEEVAAPADAGPGSPEPAAPPEQLSSPAETVAAEHVTSSPEPEADEGGEDDSAEDATGEPVTASNPQVPGAAPDGTPRRRRRRRRRGRKPQAQGGV